MAKTARLTGNIQGHAGQALTWTIYSDHGTQLPSIEEVKATLADGVSFNYDSGDAEEIFAPFVSSTVDLGFIVDHDDEINALVDMARGTESDTYIVVEEATGWRWVGNLLPEDVEVEITDGHTEIGMTFTDGLSLLKGIDFLVDSDDIFIRTDETAGEPYKPGRTALGLAWVILNKIPWMQEVSWPSGTVAMREAAGIGTDTSGLYRPNMPYMGINPSAFSKEKRNPRRSRQMPKAKSFVNCYDVLGDILEAQGLRIAWDGEGWAMRSPLIADDFATGIVEYTYAHSDLLANGRGAIDGSVNFTQWNYNLDTSYAMSKGATRRFTQRFSGARAVHVEAGSNQLFNKFDKVKYPDADRLENKQQLSDSDPLVEFEAESDITLRTKGKIDLKGGVKAKNASGHKPCAVIRLKLGTTSHSADPYLLSSEMSIQTYDTSITGAAAASEMRCWQNAQLADAEWITESNKGAGPYDAPGLLYIPLTWSGDSFKPNAPTVDHSGDGTFYGGLHTALKSGEANVLKYDKWGQLHFDVTLPTLTSPSVDVEGYEIEFGLAFFAADEFPVGSNQSPEILNTVTGDTTGTGTAEEELYNEYIENFIFSKGRFFKGDGTGEADRIYFEETSNGAPDSFEFAEVRVSSGTQSGEPAVGPKFINRNKNLWSAGSEDWGYDIDWISYSGTPSANPATQENLELLADEWLYNNASGVEVLSASFAPSYEAFSTMPTGADIFFTTCTTAGTGANYYLPTRLTWSSITGLDFEGVEMLRSETTVVTPGKREEEEEIEFVSPFIKSIDDGLGGKNKTTSDTEILSGQLKTAQDDATALVDDATTFSEIVTESLVMEIHGQQGGRGISGPELYKLNGGLTQTGTEVTNVLHFIGGVDNTGTAQSADVLKVGLTDRDVSRVSTSDYNTATGGLTVNAYLDPSTGSAGDVITIDAAGTGVEWAAPTGGGGGGSVTDIDDLGDVTITTASPLDFLIYNGANWANNGAQATANTIAALSDLDDLRDVDTTGVTDGQVLVYDNASSEWTVGDLPTVPTVTLDSATSSGNTTTNNITVGDISASAASLTTLEVGSPLGGFLTYPSTDGTSGQAITTDGAGNLSFTTISGGGGSTPTLDDVVSQGASTSTTVELDGGFSVDPDGVFSNLSTAFIKNQGDAWTQVWTNSSGVVTAYLSNAGQLVMAGSINADSIQQSNGAGGTLFSLPTTAGTSGQVMAWPSTGTELEWATASGGGGNKTVTFDGHCYNSVTTSTDQNYWLPGSATYGFEFYDNNETSSLSTSATWNRYKKMSHRLEAGTYDIDFNVDVSMSNSTNGTSHSSDYAGQDIEVRFYKVGRSGTNGNVTISQIGTTQTNTQSSSDTAVGTTTEYSVSGEVFDGEQRVMVVLKGTINQTSTRYAHWVYDINAEKTA